MSKQRKKRRDDEGSSSIAVATPEDESHEAVGEEVFAGEEMLDDGALSSADIEASAEFGVDDEDEDDPDATDDDAESDTEVSDEDDSDEEREASAEEESEFILHDADAEDAAAERALLRASLAASSEGADDEVAPGGQPREMAELMAIIEALIFVSEEPLTAKTIAEVLREDKGWAQVACESLAKEFNERNGGLMLREVAGGWQLATRPEHHEHVRAFLKSKPSAKLSLAALETLAVIAYKQPVTVPEILEIRGVTSSSAIKTLLDKRLIVAKGRKETVGRPMMYGTSKDFLMQFGLKDLNELPSIEDFEDLAGGES